MAQFPSNSSGASSSASGIWSLNEQIKARGGDNWPSAASVPGAPVLTTTTTSSGQVTVYFNTPADTGGLPANQLTYTVTASPGGATASGSSSPITVTGLTNGSYYTFTATATNLVGTSAASNSLALTAPGQAQYTTPGTYSWTAPAGVSKVSVVTVGAGGGGGGYSAGLSAGGALGYKNNLTVTPGQNYTVVVGSPGSFGGQWGTGGKGGASSFTADGGVQVGADGGVGSTFTYTPSTPLYGSSGGNGGHMAGSSWSGGGGGAGGYSGNGGSQDNSSGTGAPTGGAGAGGSPSGSTSGYCSGGGGVGLLGEGASGTYYGGASGGGGGSGGTKGSDGGYDSSGNTLGGNYGGGGGGAWHSSGFSWSGTSTAGGGAVRIIWGGAVGQQRTFPSTNTGNL